jgi:hypothetical protein
MSCMTYKIFIHIIQDSQVENYILIMGINVLLEFK